MRRAFLLVVPLFAAACARAGAPAPVTAAARPTTPEPSVVPRYASSAPPPPAFLDATREASIAALVPVLEQRIDAFFASEKPPSLAVAMVVDGKVAFTRVLGVRDKASKAPATDHTLYRIGSISKTFTAELVLSLRDAGLVRLDDPAEASLPELAHVTYPFRDAPRITLRHLLTHTSGLPRLGDFDYTGDHDVTRDEMLGALDRARLDHAPGTRYVYSNFGLSLVGEIVARRAPEKSLRAALAKRLTEPLGMRSTTFDPGTLATPELATGYAKKDDEKGAAPWKLGVSEASGGLWSNVGDMARWVAFQLAAWPPRDGAEAGPIARASLREAHMTGFPLGLHAKASSDLEAEAAGIGLGWHTHETCAYEHLVEHGGAIDGFNAAVGFAPDHGFGFVVLASSIDTPTNKLRAQLFEAAKALPPRREVPAPETAKLVDAITASFGACSEDGYRAMLAPRFQKAVPYPEYARLCGALSKLHGACKSWSVVSLDAPRRGRFSLACERGSVLATVGVDEVRGEPRIDMLYVRSVGIAPSKDTLRAAESALAAYGAKWDEAKVAALFEVPVPLAVVRDGFEAARAKHGACKLAPEAARDGGDGDRGGALKILCEKTGPQLLLVGTNAKGKVVSFQMKPLEDAAEEPRCIDARKKAPPQ